MFKYVFKHRALKSHLNQPWLLELSPNGLLSSFSLPSFCILLPHRSAYRITPLILKPFHGSPLTLRWNPCHFAGPSKPSAKLLNISLTLANWTLCYTLNSHCSSYLCLVLFFLCFSVMFPAPPLLFSVPVVILCKLSRLNAMQVPPRSFPWLLQLEVLAHLRLLTLSYILFLSLR